MFLCVGRRTGERGLVLGPRRGRALPRRIILHLVKTPLEEDWDDAPPAGLALGAGRARLPAAGLGELRVKGLVGVPGVDVVDVWKRRGEERVC